MPKDMLATEQDDAHLVERSRARDPEAFRRLVERHQRLVLGVAVAITRDRALAEDVAQEAFVIAWRTLDKLKDVARPGPWLCGIARHVAQRAVRRRGRAAEAAWVVTDELADAAPSVLERAVEAETEAVLWRALGELKDSFREALVLFYIEGRSVRAVAEGLGISEELVKQRLHRGRETLRRELTARFEERLEALRPGPGFAAAVVAAALVTQVGEAGAATAAIGAAATHAGGSTMLVTKISLVLGAAAALGGALYLARGGAGAAGGVGRAAAGSAASPADAPAERAARPGSVVAPAAADGSLHVRRMASADERARRLAAIASRRHGADAATPKTYDFAGRDVNAAPPPPRRPPGVPASPKEYIRAAVGEIIPLLADCHVQRLTDVPGLEGTIVVDFTIVGDVDEGGLIGTSEIMAEGTTIADPGMLECVRETMYAIQIDPPEGGEGLRVVYPFAFAPGAPDDGADGDAGARAAE